MDFFHVSGNALWMMLADLYILQEKGSLLFALSWQIIVPLISFPKNHTDRAVLKITFLGTSPKCVQLICQ